MAVGSRGGQRNRGVVLLLAVGFLLLLAGAAGAAAGGDAAPRSAEGPGADGTAGGAGDGGATGAAGGAGDGGATGAAGGAGTGAVGAGLSPGAGADLILLLDRSGSMVQNDPQDLSLTGARVLLSMLDPDDRVAVIAFDTHPRTVLPLSRVGDGVAARDALGAIGRPAGQWTDIRGALAAALRVLDGQSGPPEDGAARRAAVLLFTDGRPETGPDGVPPGYREAMGRAVEALAMRAVPVFTVGLGEADFAVLGAIAEGSRAESFAAASPVQAVRLFSEVLGRLKGREAVLSVAAELAPGQVGVERRFRVPPYTRLLTVSAVGTGGQVEAEVRSPSGAAAGLPGVTRTAGERYVVYAIGDPEPGLWTVRLTGEGRVEGLGQVESALRLRLLDPPPYSRVDGSRPVQVRVAVEGVPDPRAPLAVWAQRGNGRAVRLAGQGHIFSGSVPPGDGGELLLWATLGGDEVLRRAFRLYPVHEPLLVQEAMAYVGAAESGAGWGRFALGGAAVAGGLGGLLALGGWNWRRLRRREEALGGRLGSLRLRGCGREAAIGPGPVLVGRGGGAPGAWSSTGHGEGGAQGAASPPGHGGSVATLTARLVPRLWSPLAGLGLGGRELHIYIRPAPGVRLQLNGRPAGDGRLYHGDEVSLGGQTYPYLNPQMARRPVRPRPRTLRSGPGTGPTLIR